MNLFEMLREKARERKRKREERRLARLQSSSGLGDVDLASHTLNPLHPLNPYTSLMGLREDRQYGEKKTEHDGPREIYPVDPKEQNVAPYVPPEHQTNGFSKNYKEPEFSYKYNSYSVPAPVCDPYSSSSSYSSPSCGSSSDSSSSSSSSDSSSSSSSSGD